MLYAWFRSRKYTKRFRAYITLELALENRPRSQYAVLSSIAIHVTQIDNGRCRVVPDVEDISGWTSTGRIRPDWIDVRSDTVLPTALATYLSY